VQNWTALCLACLDLSGRQQGPTGQLRSAPGSSAKRADSRIIALLLSHGADPNGGNPDVSSHDVQLLTSFDVNVDALYLIGMAEILTLQSSAEFEWAQVFADMGHAHVWPKAEHKWPPYV